MSFAILDFGSQYTKLIARRFRELGYASVIFPYDVSLDLLKKSKPAAIILSGGPNSVLDSDAPCRSVTELQRVAPVLAICYGMQMLAKELGASLLKSQKRSYGKARIKWETAGVSKVKQHIVWMSHGDSVSSLPAKARLLARNEQGVILAFAWENLWAFQFHPEVSHTEYGMDILKSFIKEFLPKLKKSWQLTEVQQDILAKIKSQVGSGKVFCALSGGVDSTVMALLLRLALGKQALNCVFVDTGLLRKGEFEEVLAMYKTLDLNVRGLRKEDEFLSQLKGVSDPEEKRKRIGRTFIQVFKEDMQEASYLAQGTLYPDVIESLSPQGQGVTIKSHHNVGGLPKELDLQLVEPLRELFKDEVRALGLGLGVDKKILYRHPFPGPGLAIRIPGVVTKEDLHTLREADAIYIEELKKQGLYQKIWQAFSVLLPVRSVGVQGDSRTYDKTLSLRAVTSKDGMTADFFYFPEEFLQQVSHRIINEVSGINRVVYDITTKPPGTIEWE